MIPVIPPEQLRPRRRWYWVGGLLIVLGLLGGLAGLVLGIVKTLELPGFAATFSGGDGPVSFRAAEPNTGSRTWLLYADRPLFSSDLSSSCTMEGPDGDAALAFPPYSHEVQNGPVEWHLNAKLEINRPGEYTIACAGPEGARFGVGYGDSSRTFALSVLGVVAMAFLPPLLGVVSGLIVVISTGVRRGRHRTRLVRAAQPGGYLAP